MKIQKIKIIDFLSKAAVIRPNPAFTINDLIKISCLNETIRLSKTNGNIFLSTEFKSNLSTETETYLVEEKKLHGIVHTTNSDSILIEKDGKNITIVADEEETVKFSARDMLLLPPEPEQPEGEGFLLTAELLYCIKIASNYINNTVLLNKGSYVYLSKDGILGSDLFNMIYYMKTDGLPDISLTTDALQIINAKKPCKYSRRGNYDFFDYGDYLYGVIGSEVKNELQPSKIFSGSVELCFTASRQSMLDFCILASHAISDKLPIGKLSYDGHALRLSVLHSERNEEVVKKVECQENKAACSDFSFDLGKMSHFLKHLPYELLTWHRAGHHFWVTSPEDENFKGFIAGIK